MVETTIDALREGLDHVVGSPPDEGVVEMVVRRPAEDEREVVAEARIEPGEGVVGDRWGASAHPSRTSEVTLMNARCVALLAGSRARWPLAGDQLYVDFDLGEANLATGTRLRVGTAVLEVSGKPHSGCAKFSARFGAEALEYVNSPEGRAARLRGLNTLVVEGGIVREGDVIAKA